MAVIFIDLLGRNVLFGGNAGEWFYGLGGNDLIQGRGGNDVVYGGAGQDRIYAGVGNDTAYGDAGRDVLYGEAGRDRLYGGDGADDLYGGTEADALWGGAGADRLIWSDGNIPLAEPGDYPVGLLDNNEPSGNPRVTLNDPFQLYTWLRLEVRNGSEVGVTEDYPRNGNGSVYFEGLAGDAKADFQYVWDPVLGVDGVAGTGDDGSKLSNLSALSYDWFRDIASTVPDPQSIALRLLIDADGNFATTNDRVALVYERTYTDPAIPEGVWVANDIYNFQGPGDTANLWMNNPGNPNGSNQEVFNRDLEDWLTTPNPDSNYPSLNSGNAVVYGMNVGMGSGWNGYFEGAVDNIQIGFSGQTTSWNFDVPVNPTPVVDEAFGFAPGTDKVVLDDILLGYNASTSDIDDFVRKQAVTGGTLLLVNQDGAGTDFQPFVVLREVRVSSVDLDRDILIT